MSISNAVDSAGVARLRYAAGHSAVDPSECLFTRDGPVQTVNREAVLLAGGGRALLMQIAHPLVATGVARHSGFEQDPLARLTRTLQLTLTIVFADGARALRAVEKIERRHAPVHGTTDEPVGRFSSGTRYDANQPELLFWVFATLLDSALFTYERFVRPLPAGDKRAFYQESKITARLFGIPEPMIPPTLADFEDYMRGMLGAGTLGFGKDGRRVADSIMDPPLPSALRSIAGTGRIFTEGMLPAELRDELGYEWNDRRQRNLERAQAFARTTLPLLPDRVRYFPQYLKCRGAGRGLWDVG